MPNKTPVIALEEHYWDAEMAGHFPAGENKSHVADLLRSEEHTSELQSRP